MIQNQQKPQITISTINDNQTKRLKISIQLSTSQLQSATNNNQQIKKTCPDNQ